MIVHRDGIDVVVETPHKVWIVAEEDSVEGGHTVLNVHSTREGAERYRSGLVEANCKRFAEVLGDALTCAMANDRRRALERDFQILEWEVAP